MKKYLICLLAFFISSTVFSQGNEWEWDEHTKDVAYEAPNSKYAKKWYFWNGPEQTDYNKYCVMSPNGSFKTVSNDIDDETGVPYTTTSSGTWKRIEKLKITYHITNVVYIADKVKMAKLPLRRRDDLQKRLTQGASIFKRTYPQGIKWTVDIYMVDDDYLMTKPIGSSAFDNLVSERYITRKDIERKKAKEEEARADEARKAEELRKAEEAKRNEEASKAEELRKAEEARKAKETENDRKAEQYVYDVVEEMPQFPGGPSALFEYLSKNIQYSKAAKKNGIQGRVLVSFIVEKDGSISNAKVEKSVEPSLDEEALRVVTVMPKWVSGKQNGVPVRVKYTVPVTFRL